MKSLNVWTEIGYGNNTMKRFIKMKNLQEYLQYVKKRSMMQTWQAL
jgi:hypothetical protein